MKALAFGDTQLGLGGAYGRTPGDRLVDQDQVLERIAELAVDRRVDLVLNGGDTFEGPGILPEQLDVFARFVARCREAGIPVMATVGNSRHDASMRTKNGLTIFEHIPGITVASRPQVHRFDGCMVAALPWVHQGRLIAQRSGRDEVDADVAALLVEIAFTLRDECAERAPDLPAILLMHWAISGATLPTGLPTEMMGEPVVPLGELERLGFDAVVASHIHRPQLLSSAPPIFYTGSPMCHDFGEEGFEHGVWILTLDAGSATTEFVPVESRSFVTLNFDHDDPVAQIELSSSLGWDVPDGAIVRVRYRATSEQQRRIDVAKLRAELLAAGAAVVKIVPDIVRAERARVVGLDETAGELDALEQWLAANTLEPAVADGVRARAREYVNPEVWLG